MTTVICPKCKQVVAANDKRDYVICCGEVIYIIYETYDSKNESGLNTSRRK
jgi:hypothetical protein